MAVTTETNRTSELTTDGAITDFDFDMLIYDESEVEVWYCPSGGSYSQLTLNTDYGVVFTEDGGTVSTDGYRAALATGTLLIIRHLALTQQTNWLSNDNHTGQQHQDDFDSSVIRDIQQQEEIDRCVKFAIHSSTEDIDFPEPEASTFIGWNAAGDALENKDDVTGLVNLAVTDGNFIVGDGTNWVAESGATARTSLGLGTGDSPQFTAVGIGTAPSYPLHILQPADGQGIRVYGFDDRSTTYFDLSVSSAGTGTFVGSNHVMLQSAAANAYLAAAQDIYAILGDDAGTRKFYFQDSGQNTVASIDSDGLVVATSGEFTTFFTVNSGGITQNGITLVGKTAGPPANRRGGSLIWRSDATTVAGYNYANSNGEWVLDADWQTGGVADQGNFAVNFTTGNITKAGSGHDIFSDFVANEHIDHSGVTLTAGTGLTGGGDITAGRTFAVDGVLEDLDTLGAASADGEFIVATGAGAFAYETTTTARTSLGVGEGDSPRFNTVAFVRADGDEKITSVYDNELDLYGTTKIGFWIGGTLKVGISSSSLFPETTNNMALGAAANEWTNVYARGLTIGADTDITGIIGRAKIAGVGDLAIFSHYDKLSAGNYGMWQTATGATYLNCTLNTKVYLQINGVTKVFLDATGLNTGNIIATGNITGTGDITRTGDITATGDVQGGTLTADDGWTGTFDSLDEETVTVVNGIITNVV